MEQHSGGVMALIDQLNQNERDAAKRAEREMIRRDAYSRAAAALAVIPILDAANAPAPAPETPTLATVGRDLMVLLSTPPTPAPAPPAPVPAVLAPSPATPPTPAASMLGTTGTVTPRSRATRMRKPSRSRRNQAAPAPGSLAADIIEVAGQNPGHQVEVLARKVMEKRKESGEEDFKRTRGKVIDLCASNKLHKDPEGSVSA